MFFPSVSVQILFLATLGLGSGLCLSFSMFRFCCWQPWVQDPDYVFFLLLYSDSVVGSPGSRIRIVFSYFSVQILFLVALGLGSGLCFLISMFRFCCWQPWVQDPDYVFSLILCLDSVVQPWVQDPDCVFLFSVLGFCCW